MQNVLSANAEKFGAFRSRWLVMLGEVLPAAHVNDGNLPHIEVVGQDCKLFTNGQEFSLTLASQELLVLQMLLGSWRKLGIPYADTTIISTLLNQENAHAHTKPAKPDIFNKLNKKLTMARTGLQLVSLKPGYTLSSHNKRPMAEFIMRMVQAMEGEEQAEYVVDKIDISRRSNIGHLITRAGKELVLCDNELYFLLTFHQYEIWMRLRDEKSVVREGEQQALEKGLSSQGLCLNENNDVVEIPLTES